MNQDPEQRAPLSLARLAPWLLILAAAVYVVHVDGPFIFDDLPFIVQNEDLRRLWPPDWLGLGGGEHAQVNSRPLLSFSLLVNYAFGGLEVRGYHLANAALHLCCALLLYGVLRLVLARVESLASRADGLALASALLWVVHPLNSEAVYYISQRSATLVGICYLATLYGFLRGLEGSRGWLVMAVAVCALGMAAKEVMVSAPLVVLLCDRALSGGSIPYLLRRRLLFYGGLAAGWLVLLRGLWVGPHGDVIGFGHGVSAWSYLLNQCNMLATYFVRALWPHPLVLDYGVPRDLGVGDIWVEGMLLLGALAWCGWALVRRPLWGWIGASFFLLLAPTSSFVPNLTEVGAERRMYLPLMVLVAASVVLGNALLVRLGRRCWEGGVLVVLAVVFWGWATIRRGEDYTSAVAIWQSSVAALPENARGHANLGVALQEEGDLAEAARHYRLALALDSAMAEGYFNLGSVLQAQGDLGEAERLYRAALDQEPTYAKAHLNLGQVLKQRGDLKGAEAHYLQALAVASTYVEAHLSLGNLFIDGERYAAAAAQYRRASSLRPDRPAVYNSLGTALALQGKYEAALEQYRKALELDPGYVQAKDNLDQALQLIEGH